MWLVASTALAASSPTQPADLSDYLIQTWQTDEGLPENSATAMVQTPDGHLWFGTFNGLVRFDGTRFRVFDRGTTPELPSAEIVNLHLDRSGRLWVSTALGMASVKDGRWTVFRHGAGWPAGNYVRFFAEGAAGTLYVTTFDNHLLELRGDRFEEVPPPPFRTLSGGLHPFIDEAGVLWVHSPGFVGRRVDGQWERRLPIAGWREEEVAFTTSRAGGFWLLSRAGLHRVEASGATLEAPIRDGPTPDAVWHLYEDSNGAVWISTVQKGLYRFDRTAGWRHFAPGRGVSYRDVRFVFEDRERNLWVGTSGGGLQRFRQRYFHNLGVEDGLPEPVVKSATVDGDGRILVGTHGGGVLRLQGERFHAITRPGSGQPIAKHVLSVLTDRAGRLWVGAYDDGLYIFDGRQVREFGITRDGRIAPWRADKDALPAGQFHVFGLFEDSRGRIWAATERGLVRWEKGVFTLFPVAGASPMDSFRCLAEEPGTGALWAGHHARGLYRFDGERLERRAEGERLERIAALHVERDGTVFIGTQDGGLGCLRRGRLTTITEEQGLPARRVGAILDDGAGALWIASNRGLVRLDRADVEAVIDGRQAALRRAQVFGRSDGLPTLETAIGNQPAAVRDTRGRLWFATVKGVTMVDPARLRTNELPAPVSIQQLGVDGRISASAEPFATTGTARPPAGSVAPGTRRIEIQYAALSFQAPEKVRFRYRLEGLDEDWVDVGDRRVAYYQDLRPGRYVFHVKAANNDALWNEEAATLAFEVQPFLWQTAWFRVLALAGLIGAVGLAVRQATRMRLRRQLERLEQQRALEREKARLALVLETTTDFVAFTDVEGRVLYVNGAGRRAVGLGEASSTQGLKVEDLLAPSAADRLRREWIPHALAHGFWSGEAVFRGAQGQEVPMSQVIAVHRAPDGSVDFLSAIARDISESKRAEEQVRTSLHEKEILLKEVHHRVKNNLQIISSLLNLQVRHVQDPVAVQAFQDSRSRVRSMALVHERLYQSASLARIDISEYVRSVAADLVHSYGADQRIRLRVDVDMVELGIDTAVPCGLLVNELVSNALKHAFPGGRLGTITLELRAHGDARWRLRISDDGVGWPEGLDPRDTTTLGMQLVVTLTDQLGGTLQRLPGSGTAFEVVFREARYKARV